MHKSTIALVQRSFDCKNSVTIQRDASRRMYEDYYGRQVGGEIPVFRSTKYQRGHGLGSIIGSLFRPVVLPFRKGSDQFLKANKNVILGNALRTGMEVADDVLEG